MHFSCESCRATLHIADEKVKGKRLVVRCKRCGARINIADPALGPMRAAAAPAATQPREAPAVVPAPAPAPAPVAQHAEEPAAGGQGADSDTESTRAMDSSVLEEALRASKAAGDSAAQSVTRAESAGAPQPAPAPAPAVPRDPPVWFAMIGGKQVGPVSRAELGLKTAQGAVGPRTYVWREGMAAWQRGKDVSELATLFAPAPERPLPAPPLPTPAVMPRAAPAPANGAAASAREAPAQPVLAPARVDEPRKPLAADPSEEKTAAAQPQKAEGALDLARWAEAELGHRKPEPAAPLHKVAQDPKISIPLLEPVGIAPGSRPLTGSVSDPFANVPDGPHFVSPGRGETTGELIARSGVQSKKRTVGLVLGLAAAVLVVALIIYGVLSREQPLAPVQTEVVRHSIGGTGDGSVGGLIKTDNNKAPQAAGAATGAESTPRRAPRQNTAVAPPVEPKKPEEPKLSAEQEAAMKALDNERGIGSHGPKAAKEPVGEPEVEKVDSALSLEDVQKKVAESKTAYKKCIDEAMNRNPRLRVGKINIATKIAPTGKVVEASIDKKDVQESPLGQCLIRTTQRMVFAPFAGETQDAIIPLHVAGGQ